MRAFFLVRRSLRHYWPTNSAMLAGVAVSVAVLAGALLVGHSVPASLRALALERLGAVDIVVTSTGFVDTSLSGRLALAAADQFGGAVPIIALEGFVTHQDSGRRAAGVQVYGVDDRFWGLHGADPDAYRLSRTRAFVSEGLARELGAAIDDALLVRVEKPSSVPLSSLHGRRHDAGRTMRLGVDRVLTGAEQGEFAVHPQQGLARSVFVSLARLQQVLAQDGRVNAVLLGIADTARLADDATRLIAAEAAVRSVAGLDDLGLRVRTIPGQGVLALEAAAGLMTDDTVAAVERAATAVGLDTQPVMTYLVNEFRHGPQSTPYSLVTALDLSRVRPAGAADPVTVSGAIPVVLNDWVANDLRAAPGDRVQIAYYVWEDAGRLTTREAELEVIDVVPLAGAAADRTLAPAYPGITEAADVGSWDPPFAIDLARIRPRDEDYWDAYRTTPKAFIPLPAGQRMWASRWGRVTSVRLLPANGGAVDAEAAAAAVRAELDPLAMGIVAYPARAMALEASSGVTDFGLYFVYFSFFLVVSALLLASLFFRLGVEQRLAEIGLLRAVGFAPRMLWRVFAAEAAVLAIAGSAIGVLMAVAYAELVMWGLRTWWVDAVGTTRLSVALAPGPLVMGGGGGIAAALATVAVTLRSVAAASPRRLLGGTLIPAGAGEGVRARLWGGAAAGSLAAVGLGLVAAASAGTVGLEAGFFGGGLLLLCAGLAATWAWLRPRPRGAARGLGSLAGVGVRNATIRPGRSVLCIALIASAAFILVAVDAFRKDGSGGSPDRQSGTGGYALAAETLLPIVHDPATAAGRDALNLEDLHAPGGVLEGVTLARFRVRPGEDASCLNLYQARNPRLLAPTGAFVAAGRFAFAASSAETAEERANPWRLLDRQFDDGAIPAIADATSLRYALHLAVGDDFVMHRDSDRPIRLRIVAALADSLFQRELIIGEQAFERAFPDADGYRFFLIDAPPGRAAEVAGALEDRLADFGLDALAAAERLAAFHRVENTYLATFQTLGGLGLLLGTLGLGAVLLRNVLERRRQLALLRAVGYRAGHILRLVLVEQVLLLGAGLTVGAACALIAIAPAWTVHGRGLPLASLGLLLLVVGGAGLVASVAAARVALRAPLLRALRTE